MSIKHSVNSQRENHTIDAEGKILGKLAVEIANKLRGKDKVSFTPNIDIGDYVRVVNSDKIVTTGNKLNQKIYYRHSGYIGNLKKTYLKDKLIGSPEKVIQRAVYGMLPKNRLTKNWQKRLTFQKEREN